MRRHCIVLCLIQFWNKMMKPGDRMAVSADAFKKRLASGNAKKDDAAK